MIDIEQKDYYNFDFYQKLLTNDVLLANEVEKSKGMILQIISEFGYSIQESFFENHFSQYCIPFVGRLYPEKFLDKFIEHDKHNKNLNDLSIEYALRKELEKYTLDELKDKPTILASIFVAFKPFSKKMDRDVFTKDYSLKISDFISVFQSNFSDLNLMEGYFNKDFFDYVFSNVETSDITWINKITGEANNVFIFALKSYLLDVALNQSFDDNLNARRLYAKLAVELAIHQDFLVEPKFNHRIIPDLMKTDTLDIICEHSKFLFENSNPVYINGLVAKVPSVNLFASYMYYLKTQSGNSSTYTNFVAQALSDGLAKLDNKSVKDLLSLMNYPSRKDSNFFNENHPLCDTENSQYNLFKNFNLFMEVVNPKILQRLNYKCVEKYILNVPKSWGYEHVRALERIMGERGFCSYLQSKMLETNSLFDFSPQIIAFMFNRSSLVEVMISRFSNDLEKIFNEALLWTKLSHIHEFQDSAVGEFGGLKIDIAILEGFKKGFFKQEVSRQMVERMANIYLSLKDYERFYLIVAGLRKHGNNYQIIINPWKKHLKYLPVTELLVNSNNKCFVKSMYFLSKEYKLQFTGVKKEDAKNILKELSVFFLDKSIPLSWLPNTDLSWSEQKETVPGILLTKYHKSLNRNIENKLDVKSFKEMVENYFDGFLIETPKNNEIYTGTWKFNHLFVNQHLKNYRKNLPLLLKELEHRPEYYALIALNAYPEVSGTFVNRLKFLVKMKTRDLLKMNIKDLLTLNFNEKYNIVEEHFLYLKHDVKVDWEICFKGVLVLVKNVFGTAKSRDVDIKSKHIASLVINAFLNFRAIYSFEVGIEQNTNVNYAYLLDPPFFQTLQDSEGVLRENPVLRKYVNEKGKDNFITSLLRHIKYEWGNSDEALNEIVFSFLSSVQEKGFNWSVLDGNDFIKDYAQKAICSAMKIENPVTKAFEVYLMSLNDGTMTGFEYYNLYKDVANMQMIGGFLMKSNNYDLAKERGAVVSLIKKACIENKLNSFNESKLIDDVVDDFKL